MKTAPPPSPAVEQNVVLEMRAVVRDLGAKARTRVLDGIDLVVRQGEFVSLTGPSGSGKSTLLYLLGLLDRPTSGAVLLEDTDVGALDDDARAKQRNEKLGFVFQFHFLLPEFSVLENVMMPLLGRGFLGARERAATVLESVGLAEFLRRRPNELSGGQQQRVAIARAMVGRPRIVLADEPTGNLDSKSASRVMDIFDRLVQGGTTIVMVTHEQNFARRASRQISLQDGRILADVRQHR